MNVEISASSKRLIQLFWSGQQQYEYITAMLWINLLSGEIPPNTDDNFLYAAEFSRSGGRCDLVVSESGEGLPHPNDAIGIPFFVLEFKSSGATDKEWETGINQMELTIAFIEKWRNFGQKIFGVVAAGQECQFFSRENGKTKPFPEGKLDLVDPNGHALQEMTKSLRFIDNDKPSKVCKNWPKVEQV